MKYTKLIKAANKAKQRSHSPYSKFRVGAAIVTRSGRIFTGCNIENSSLSLTMCAERTAISKAISEGQRQFTAIAIASDAKDFITPCGACRQVLMDLAGNINVVMTDGDGRSKTARMTELLPMPFTNAVLTHIL
ncbi:MAG: cytidine deaminase [Ignavibacteria bacterium]|nr:cytidine deaminase [Ignavibacteria bacterium]